MTPEGKVKAKIKLVLAKHNIWYCMPVGSGFGRSGVPDFICCAYGRMLAIESKAGKGKTTALQDRELERIRTCDGIALVIDDLTHTTEYLEKILIEIKMGVL